MSDTLPSHHGRGKILFLSLVALMASTVLVAFLVSIRPEPAEKEDMGPVTLTVQVFRTERGTHPVKVEVFGSAQAAKSVRLQAPFAGTVTAVSDLFLGKILLADEALFNVEKVKLELDIREFEVQIQELEIKRQRLARENEILRERIETAQELYEVSVDAVTKEQERLRIQGELFANFKELYDKETISYNEYLEAEALLKQVELAVLTAKTNRNARKDGLELLKQSLNTNDKELANIGNEKEILGIQIADAQNDLKKAVVSVDFPSQIVELFIDTEQEVTAGAPLATVRSIDASQLQVNVPDAYFRWLYAGDLLSQKDGEGEWDDLITIELVNREFPKAFTGAYLKAVGESVSVPSRSLPILIERRNPLDDEGLAIPQEALRPGMYCKVTLKLDEVPDTFLISPGALQVDGSILHAVPGETDESWTLGIATNVEVIHEGEDGVLIRIPEAKEELWVVEAPIRAPKVGTPLKILPEEAP